MTPSSNRASRPAVEQQDVPDAPLRVLTAEDHARWGPVVRRTAMRVARRAPDEFDVESLCRRGFVGLLDALRSAEAMTSGEPSDAYVEHRIRATMIDFVRAVRPRVREARRASREIARTMRSLAEVGSPNASGEELAAALGTSVADYEQRLEDIADAGIARIDVLDFDDEADRDPPLVCRRTLAECIDALPLRERNLLGLLFEEDLSIEEAAAVLGTTSRKVTCLLTQAVHRLRAALGKE